MEVDRRAIFQEYIRRFNPTGDPAVPLREKFYIPSPQGTAARLASRFAIDNSSAHLVVGGIGSGKTTELLALKERLDALGDIRGLFVDVPATQRITKLRDGVLVALAWKAISGFLNQHEGPGPHVPENVESIRRIVDGYWDEPYDMDQDDGLVRVSGLVTPPERDSDLEKLEAGLAALTTSIPERFVILFDGLDRVPLKFTLSSMILRDAGALKRAGIGCVIVGPQGMRRDLYRHIVERFTSFHVQGADVSMDTGQAFLESVLEARAAADILPQESRARLAAWSGGLVRDLISLARDSGQAAYESGADRIDPSHVDVAADRFGRSLLLGISTPMANRLLDLRPRGDQVSVEFTATSEVDVEMLSLRVIVEVPGAPVRYIIHPTVTPLLRGFRKTA